MSQILLSLIFHVLIDWETECCMGQMPMSVTCNNHYASKCTYSGVESCQAWLEANSVFGKVGRPWRVILGGTGLNCLFWLYLNILMLCSLGKEEYIYIALIVLVWYSLICPCVQDTWKRASPNGRESSPCPASCGSSLSAMGATADPLKEADLTNDISDWCN